MTATPQPAHAESVIHTLRQNCRRCYSCVRECPAKAIRIVDGQATVVDERCIGCGSCLLVCSQGARAYATEVERAEELLDGGAPVAALVAPSFPAAFPEVTPAGLVSALRRAGFRHVVEVAHGAELVASAYRQHLAAHPTGLALATCCPAVVEYVRRYRPDLVGCLVPLVSPMIAAALEVRAHYGADVRCVFVGPCVAKKVEARDPALPRVVDAVLTFEEIRRLLHERGVALEASAAERSVAEGGFDPPAASVGRAFPLEGGLAHCAGRAWDGLRAEVLVAGGPARSLEVLSGLRADEQRPLLVEALMCPGCACGPAAGTGEAPFRRARRIQDYLATSPEAKGSPVAEPKPTVAPLAPMPTPTPAPTPAPAPPLSLTRTFAVEDHRLPEPTEERIRSILARTNKFSRADELNCGACGYPTCRDKARAVANGMAEEAMCLPFMVEQAERVCHELHVPWRDMTEVHQHLINAEKLASMGQMAAGVAHELNNPLASILLYTGLLGRKLKDRPDIDADLRVLVDEAGRCKRIIGNLLDFARQNRVRLERTCLGTLLERIVTETAFAAGPANVEVQALVAADLEADVDSDQLTQALVNLVKNGIEAMEGKPGRVILRAEPAPTPGRIRISVSDTGRGITGAARDRVFQPFFTTKGIGKGTGLGLPIVYGIVKMHRGRIWFESEEGKGTTFHIELPAAQGAVAAGGRS